MINRRIASEEARKVRLLSIQGNAISLLTELIDSLSTEYCGNPRVYKNEKEPLMWIEYPDFCYDCDIFFEEYGIPLAFIEKEYPAKIYGLTNSVELGELTSQLAGDQVVFRKRNCSGADFEMIRSLCLEVRVNNPREFQACWELLSHMDYRCSYAAVSRSRWMNTGEKDWKEKDPDTYFKYLQIKEEESDFFLDFLTLEQKKELWTVYFETGSSPLEFEYLNEAISQKENVNIFEWNLALQMAAAAAGIGIRYEKDDFRVTDKTGRRLWMDYQSLAAAEKLFLKLLFPAVPRER